MIEIKDLDKEIALVKVRIKNATNWKLKNDLEKYLKRLRKEKEIK